MKTLPIIPGVLAVIFVLAHDQFGPIYSMYDECECHRSRA